MDSPSHKIEIDFPAPLPITEAELALIEMHFGAAIAALADETPNDAHPS